MSTPPWLSAHVKRIQDEQEQEKEIIDTNATYYGVADKLLFDTMIVDKKNKNIKRLTLLSNISQIKSEVIDKVINTNNKDYATAFAQFKQMSAEEKQVVIHGFKKVHFSNKYIVYFNRLNNILINVISTEDFKDDDFDTKLQNKIDKLLLLA